MKKIQSYNNETNYYSEIKLQPLILYKNKKRKSHHKENQQNSEDGSYNYTFNISKVIYIFVGSKRKERVFI